MSIAECLFLLLLNQPIIEQHLFIRDIVNLIQDGGAHELTTRTRNSCYIANFSGK